MTEDDLPGSPAGDERLGSLVAAAASRWGEREFLVLGEDSAWGWLETVPGGWRRCLQRQKGRTRIVIVDPVVTESARHSDVHLRVRPGQDWGAAARSGQGHPRRGLEHREDCRTIATGVDDLRALVASADLDDLAAGCEIPRVDIERVAREFAGARTAMAITRTGISLHEAGTIGEWLGHVPSQTPALSSSLGSGREGLRRILGRVSAPTEVPEWAKTHPQMRVAGGSEPRPAKIQG